jgi:2-C-methyl-D-erythritol 4-phosphate cytidylyltransferase
MRKAVLLVAGGTGTRMGSSIPKQFLPIKGKPVIIRTIEQFLSWDSDIDVIISIYPDAKETLEELLSFWLPNQSIRIVPGGATRTLSVWYGTEALFAQVERPDQVMLLIHDAVRPLIQHSVLDTNLATALQYGNAVSCVPVKSSLRRKTESGSEAVDRSAYYHVQTPQTFILSDFHEWMNNRPHDEFTDDASLAEYCGAQIFLSEGSYENIKITTPDDIILAEHLWKEDDTRD